MPLPPESSKGRVSEYAARIASILGICLSSVSCSTSNAETFGHESAPSSLSDKYEGCRTIVEEDRTDIFCFLKEGTRRLIPVSKEQFKRAKAKNTELTGQERNVLYTLGGDLFNLQHIPGMNEECPTVMQKGSDNAAVKVYMRFPEVKDKSPRIIFFLHGNGGQNMAKKDTTNVIEFTREMQRKGDPIILIAPQDGWGNFYPEGREKDEPGNWRDFHDPNTFANLIAFAEGIAKRHATDISLVSFSGGNIGIKKLLGALEKAKEESPEMADLYKMIQRVVYFDSATGEGSEQVARWMDENPNATLWNCYNRDDQYNQGNAVLLETLIAHGISATQIHTEGMKFGFSGHGIFREYYRRYLRR